MAVTSYKRKKTRISPLVTLFSDFNSLIHSDLIRSLSRTSKQDFTRDRKMTFAHLIYYLIFRDCNNSNSELSKFYASIHQFDQRISKQALHKSLQKLNPFVFRHLLHQFAQLFYHSSLPKTFRGYTLLAEDGTYLEIPYSIRNLYTFQFVNNQHVKDMFHVKKVNSKCGGIYDITNGLFLDFSIHPAPYSETPIAFEHLYKTHEMLKDRPVIYLADSYYGSAEIISHLEAVNYKYCIRGKKNFYKKQVQCMSSDDEWIHVEVDDKWRKRFRFSMEAIGLRKELPALKIRVIKHKYQYQDEKNQMQEEELIYFTNLCEKEFTKQEVIELYTQRWDIEVSYKTLKSQQELERYISVNGTVAQCCIYAKLLFHNLVGVFRKE